MFSALWEHENIHDDRDLNVSLSPAFIVMICLVFPCDIFSLSQEKKANMKQDADLGTESQT